MKPTLLILAAGMGSRYGGLKQLDELGPGGEKIIDYSVYDAIEAGFGKVVFIIRESFEKDFKEKVSSRFASKIQVEHVYQEMDSLVPYPVNREKPWGTGHAVLVAKDVIQEPFAVINADDYYGVEGFKVMANFLMNEASEDLYSMVGYRLKNTLSDNGSVSRGVCSVDNENFLLDVVERTKIERDPDGIIRFKENESTTELSPQTSVSMNFWGFHHNVFQDFHEQFLEFVDSNKENPKAEFYIPLVANNLLKENKIKLKVLDCEAQWFGVTYKEDKPVVQRSFQELASQGTYPTPLWS